MSSRRTLILIGALVAGAVAALLIFQYVGGIKEKAQGDAQMVNVVIAKAQIAKGAAANDLIAAKAIDIGERRQVELPTNVVTRPEEIKGQIAQLDIAPGTIITASMFQSDAALTNSVSQALKPNMVAVSVSVDQVHSVSGLISQGDYVNLTVVGSCKSDGSGKATALDGGTATSSGGDTTSGAAAGGSANAAGTVGCAASLYQKIRILGIGRSLGTGASSPVATADGTTPGTTQAPTSDMITFEVPQEAAQVLQLAPSLYMTLIRKDYEPHPVPITPFLPTPGVDGQTPYGGDPETKTAGQ